MAKLFRKCFGNVVLMTAAALWAGCSDSEKNDDAAKQDSSESGYSWENSEFIKQQREKKNVDENIKDNRCETLYGCAGYGEISTVWRGAKLSFINIESADKQALDQKEYLKFARKRIPVLDMLYSKFHKKFSMKNAKALAGEITLKLTIAENGSVKEVQIISSTTDYTEFDEEIKAFVSRWKFPKVESDEIIATLSIRFYEVGVKSSSSQSK